MDLVPPQRISEDEDLQASFAAGRWTIARGDFAQSATRRRARDGCAVGEPLRDRLSAARLHTLVLAREAATCARGERGARRRTFLFAGVSGAGKTTITRARPARRDAATDEISHLRRAGEGYEAFGTPSRASSRARRERARAAGGVYLSPGRGEPGIEPLGAADAARGLLESVLFFAEDPEREAGVRRGL